MGPAISFDAGYFGQGVAVNPGIHRQYFGATSRNVTRFNGSWRHAETDAEIRNNGNPTPILADIQQGTAHTMAIPEVTHFGAIDYHDGYLWVGLLEPVVVGDPSSGRQAAIAKIDAATFELVQVWDLLQEANRLGLPGFLMRGVDPVDFDGNHLWVGTSNGIFRFTVVAEPDGSQRFSEVAAFNFHPQHVGEPGSGQDQLLYPQGLRAVGDRLYVSFPSLGASSDTRSAMAGLYEFAIPSHLQGLTGPPMLPLRIWHLPQQSGRHLEGFDFVPGREDEIYLSQSNGRLLERLRLEGLAVPVDGHGLSTPTDHWTATTDEALASPDFRFESAFHPPLRSSTPIVAVHRQRSDNAGNTRLPADRHANVDDLPALVPAAEAMGQPQRRRVQTCDHARNDAVSGVDRLFANDALLQSALNHPGSAIR